MSFAPPIARDGFYYNGDLYVEVGNLNRHKRASIAEITAILRPDFKQSKALPVTLPSKDPVGHWYEAQLIHYGLLPSKDKARAKMRLLEALNTSKLNIPAHISQLEDRLKKEYAVVERKARALYKAEKAAAEKQEPVTESKKRKQPEPSNTFNVNINFGPVNASSYQISEPRAETITDVTQPPMKKTKATATVTAKTAVTTAKKGASATYAANGRVLSNQNSVGKETSSKAPAADQTKKANRPANKDPTPERPKQTARKSATIKKESAAKKESPVKKEHPVKKESPIKKGPIAGKPSTVKEEPKVKKEPTNSRRPKLGLINGAYEITCQDLEQWENFGDDMSMILCLDSPEVWGAYDFGMFSGVIHMQIRPWAPSEEPIPFKWRGRENSEGEMSFGDHCQGEITFLGDGRIVGWLNVYGQCHFQGQRRPGPGTAPRSAASMQEEWDGYSEESYEHARVSRWR
ncbi:MAG: hypothetical protein Q9209_006722 [Squamulea sp. 1 TL-2023]